MGGVVEESEVGVGVALNRRQAKSVRLIVGK